MKGRLRIAIEKFINEFPFQIHFWKWIKYILEEIEDELLEVHDDILNNFPYKNILPDFIKNLSNRVKTNKKPVQIIPIIISIVLMVLGLVIGIFAPLQRYGSRQIDKFIHSNLPDINSLLTFLYFGLIDETKFRDIMLEQGFDFETIQNYLKTKERLLTINDYIIAWRRKLLRDEIVDDYLQKQGLSQQSINLLKLMASEIPHISDLIRFMVRDVFNESIVKKYSYDEEYPQDIEQYTEKLGLSKFWTEKYWLAHWELPSPTQGYEMLHRLRPGKTNNPFTIDDLRELLKISDYPKYYRDRLIEISYLPLTRVDVRRMYTLGVLDENGVYNAYLDLGYNEENARKLTEFTIKYETSDNENEADKIKSFTKSLLDRLYKKNLIPVDEYIKRMKELKYSDEVINKYVELINYEKLDSMYPDLYLDYIRDTISRVEKGLVNLSITETQARQILSSLGLSESDINYLVLKQKYQFEQIDKEEKINSLINAYLENAIDESKLNIELNNLNLSANEIDKILNLLSYKKQFRSRKLTEGQYRAATHQGIISVDDYIENLKELGYTDKDIDILVKLNFSEGSET